LPLPGIEPWFLGRPACSSVATLTAILADEVLNNAPVKETFPNSLCSRKLCAEILKLVKERYSSTGKMEAQRFSETYLNLGRAIAQSVNRQLPTAAARVRGRVKSRGIYGGQSGTGAGFLRVLRFPLPIRIPPIAPQS
jgi:hypothetical protein